ncbi:hypothetical protein LTR95_000647 [Oleoguttula sp. CCFEE 5521]
MKKTLQCAQILGTLPNTTHTFVPKQSPFCWIKAFPYAINPDQQAIQALFDLLVLSRRLSTQVSSHTIVPILDTMSTSLFLSRAFYATLDGEKLRGMSFVGRISAVSERLQQFVEVASASGDVIAAMRDAMWAVRRVLTAWRKYPGIGQRLVLMDPASVVITTTEYYYTAKEVVKPAPVGSLRFKIADLLAVAIDTDSAGMENLSIKDLNRVLTQVSYVAEQKYWAWYNMVEDLGSEVADDTPELEAETKTFSAVLYNQDAKPDGETTSPPTIPSQSAPATTVTQTITDQGRAKPGRKTGVQGKIASKGEKWLNDEFDYVQEHYFDAPTRPTHPQLYRDFNAHFAGTAVQLRENGPIRYRDAWVPKSQDVSDAKARDEDQGHRTYNGLQQFVMKLQKIDNFEPKTNWAYDAAATRAAVQPIIATPLPATVEAVDSDMLDVSVGGDDDEVETKLEAFRRARGSFGELHVEEDE